MSSNEDSQQSNEFCGDVGFFEKRPLGALLSWRVVLLVAVFGCLTSSCEQPRLEQLCRFGNERLLVSGGGSLIHDVELVRTPRGMLAAWTDASGTHVMPLDEEGVPSGPRREVGPPARSLDLTPYRSEYLLGVLRPGDLVWGGGSAFLVQLDGSGATRRSIRPLGRAGYYSRGIAVGESRGVPVVLWSDGVPGDVSVRLARGQGEPVRLSSPGSNGCCPSLVEIAGETHAMWGQYEVERSGSSVVLMNLEQSETAREHRVLVSATVAEPWPVATSTDGGLDLVYRSRRQWDTRDQLVFTRFDSQLQTTLSATRLGRYDGPTAATLLTNGSVWVSVAIRSWSREMIVALDRFNGLGERLGAEMHVFADEVRFTDVDAIRVNDRYVFIYAEDEPSQRIWLAEARCRY